jgi:hypothetical protein
MAAHPPSPEADVGHGGIVIEGGCKIKINLRVCQRKARQRHERGAVVAQAAHDLKIN